MKTNESSKQEMKIVMDSHNSIAYIYSSDEMTDYKSYILDTNLVILLEQMYYYPQNLSSFDRDVLLEYFRTNSSQDKDPIMGFAMQESCWNYKHEKLDEEKQMKLSKVMEEMNYWNENDAIEKLNQKNFQYDKHIFLDEYNKNHKYSVVKQLNKIFSPLLPIYIVILEIYILYFRDGMCNRKKSVLEFNEFVANRLKISLTFEVTIALALFLGNETSSNHAKKVLKIDKKQSNISRKLINISWDFLYFRLLMAGQPGTLDKCSKKVVLVTRDKSMISLAKLIKPAGEVNLRKLKVPIYEVSYSEIRHEFRSLYSYSWNKINGSVFYRALSTINEKNDINRLVTLAENLEKELQYILLENDLWNK